MRGLRSFRVQLIVGSILGSLGLLPLMHLLSLHLMHLYPAVMSIGFQAMMAITLGGLLFVGFGLAHFWRGLAPFGELRSRLAAVRDGTNKQIDGRYPAEVQPLVNDLNALLEHRERIVHRALSKAGDLAHGLKTPLAVLAQEAERVRAAGYEDVAAAIGHEVERMRRQIDYHLAQARAAASGAAPGARCAIRESADALARTLTRLNGDNGLAIDIAAAADCVARCEREDVDEMLGNLLDNACKWTRGRVTLESHRESTRIIIVVDDDGPGLPIPMRDTVLKRGVRADEAAPGSGLGLAIVRDLAELYGGTIRLDASPLGGLRARLELPAA